MNKIPQLFLILVCLWAFAACSKTTNNQPRANSVPTNSANTTPVNATPPDPSPEATTSSPIGKFNFKNYTYPLPRGWQDETSEIVLQNGMAPVSLEEDARKIGASYVRKSFGDVTGDGRDESFVIIKIETGGSAIPQMVYIFQWKDNAPDLLWSFRTGDRADGGLKDVRAENGNLIVELYGQDRYIFNDVETLKITGDEDQLCCPTSFTRNRYKLTGGRFVLQGKRLTFSEANPTAPPIENKGDAIQTKKKK